jgi:hypothetical protein
MNKRLVFSVVFIVAVLMSACAPGVSPVTSNPTGAPEPTVQPTIIPTEKPTIAPTATATPMPLSALKLDSLLIQSGDLPAGLSGAQIRDTAPLMFEKVPKADNTIYQQVARNGKQAGGVAVFLYEDTSKVDEAYKEILSGMGSDANPVSEIGDKASIMMLTLGMEGGDLVFERCNFVVHVRFTGTPNADDITSYAKRLDARLSEVACR